MGTRSEKGPGNFKTVIAFDQSYNNFGVAVAEDGKLLKVTSIPLAKKAKTKVLKRQIVRRGTRKLVAAYNPDIIVVERVRMFSQRFISLSTIIALGGIIACIQDAAPDIPVYSVDTRNWKARVLGSAKADKEDAVIFVNKLGFLDIDHDAADAACMALSAWNPNVKLKLEK